MHRIRLVFSFLAILAFSLVPSASKALPFCLPPAAPDPVMMRVVPEECLFYYGWNGAATADPKSANQTEQMLAEPEVQAFITQLESELMSLLARSLPPDPVSQSLGKQIPSLLRTMLTHPMAMYVSKVEPPTNIRLGLVLKAGKDAQKVFESLVALETLGAQMVPGNAMREVSVAGLRMRQIPIPGIVWGFYKDEYLVLSLGTDETQALLTRMGGSGTSPAWYQNLNKTLAIDRPSSVFYVNVAGMLQAAAPMLQDPKINTMLNVLGVNNLSYLGSVDGLDKTGIASKTLIGIKGTPTGVFAMLQGSPIGAADLQPFPRDASMASIIKMDLSAGYQKVLALMGQIDPSQRQSMLDEVAKLEAQIGFKLDEGLFKALGDSWGFYSAPAADGKTALGAMTVSIRDRAAFEKTYQTLLAMAKAALAGAGNPDLAIKESKYKGTPVYYLKLPASLLNALPGGFPGAVPGGLPGGAPGAAPGAAPAAGIPGLTPSWCITQDRLVFALDPNTLKTFLSRDSSSGSFADRTEIAAALATKPITLNFQDFKESVKSGYPTLQTLLPQLAGIMALQGLQFKLPALPSQAAIEKHALPNISFMTYTADGILMERHHSIPYTNINWTSTAPVAIALLLPAVQAARESARRAQGANNLKNLLLAMLNYESVYKTYPVAMNPKYLDKDGKPFLSWRVHILPFVEQQALYDRFKLDEPWDSPNNRPLVDLMPDIYQFPGATTSGKTVYLAAAGPSALFSGKTGPTLRAITDGTANTIAIVEATQDKAVIWTKPDDLIVDPKDPQAGLKSVRPGGCQVGFADGSVHFLTDMISLDTLRALFTPAGGEPITPFE